MHIHLIKPRHLKVSTLRRTVQKRTSNHGLEKETIEGIGSCVINAGGVQMEVMQQCANRLFSQATTRMARTLSATRSLSAFAAQSCCGFVTVSHATSTSLCNLTATSQHHSAKVWLFLVLLWVSNMLVQVLSTLSHEGRCEGSRLRQASTPLFSARSCACLSPAPGAPSPHGSAALPSSFPQASSPSLAKRGKRLVWVRSS